MTPSTQRRLSASQQARLRLDSLIYPSEEQSNSADYYADDWAEPSYYEDFEAEYAIPGESDGSRWGDPENGDNDAYEIFY